MVLREKGERIHFPCRRCHSLFPRYGKEKLCGECRIDIMNNLRIVNIKNNLRNKRIIKQETMKGG